jgi:deazaflavin-dependent oxidoreductase (nitroreductase family)
MGGTGRSTPPRLPPRWFIRVFWVGHRALFRGTGGRLGLARPKPGKAGLMRLRTVGRRSGDPHAVMLAYIEDGPNLVTLAMNGWGDPPPAWWLNLQAGPQTTVDLPGEERAVRGRAAQGDERERLWARYAELIKGDLDEFAAMRSRETPVVVLEPAPGGPT